MVFSLKSIKYERMTRKKIKSARKGDFEIVTISALRKPFGSKIGSRVPRHTSGLQMPAASTIRHAMPR